jgi:hypothetical protein
VPVTLRLLLAHDVSPSLNMAEPRSVDPHRDEETTLGTGFSTSQLLTLLDLAADGDEVTFRELARCLGVPTIKVDALWNGVRRLPLCRDKAA